MIFPVWEILAGIGGGAVERFVCETMVVSGDNAIRALEEHSCSRMMVVTEPRLRQEKCISRILLAAGDPETEYLDVVNSNAAMKLAVEGSRQIKSFHPDLVVAFGGRNVLECSKAMVCFSGHSCLFAAVPTAFGSGEEVSDRVLLQHNGRIHLLCNKGMHPDMTILDSSFLEYADKGEFRENGFALLAAALEAYTGARTGFLGMLHAREAFAASCGALPAAFSGKKAALERMQMASVLTGLAVKEAGLGLCCAMGHSLEVIFGLSRGKAAAILLPAIVGCNAHAAGNRYAELSRAAGMGGSSEGIGTRNLRGGLIRLRRELGLPGTLVQAGIDIRSVWNNGRRIVEMTLEDPECRNNPVTVDDFVVRRILDEITGRI